MMAEGIGAKIKRAFLWHWHLLGLGTGAGFALLSGMPAAWLPLLAAAELAYLGLLGLHPRFQAVLRGEALAKDGAASASADAAARYEKIISFLTDEDRERFSHLQQRCASLLDLRRRMDSKDGDDGVDEFRGESLDRMLWLCLKLLHQRSGLERFLASTKRGQIEFELRVAEEQLAESRKRDGNSAGGVEGRLTTSIVERIKTINERLQNYDKATESLELVGSEIEKTEQQITHLCEVGMTMRDSAGLTAQIDSISESLQSSEQSFAHASVAQILDADEAAPPLLSGSLTSSSTGASPPPLRRAARN
ncbi:MAG: hypothetical protein K1X78_12845 [Verrucomicrobiaceae bacterium]|nr:hypothetical protein [Verrucomicrobiaceae bacterium]